MPWKKVLPMDEKIRFISDYLNSVFTFTELCDRYNISRKTGYKWVHCYIVEGAAGLEDRARVSRHSLHKTSDEMEAAILAVRRKHSVWGASKILTMLELIAPLAIFLAVYRLFVLFFTIYTQV
ncbi:MAG: helix-turn-helix domain-containing protein [Candidatus Hodarchaeota archaeon]